MSGSPCRQRKIAHGFRGARGLCWPSDLWSPLLLCLAEQRGPAGTVAVCLRRDAAWCCASLGRLSLGQLWAVLGPCLEACALADRAGHS